MAHTKAGNMQWNDTLWMVVGFVILVSVAVLMLFQVFSPGRRTAAPLGKVTDITPDQSTTLSNLERAAGTHSLVFPLTPAQEATLRRLEEQAGVKRNKSL